MISNIYITHIDQERLQKIINEIKKSGDEPDKTVKKLELEISRAKIVDSQQISPDIITMNSRALLLLEQEEVDISLVYPEEADWSSNKMSILSPIGTAILGYRAGDIVDWEVPSGIATIHIKELLYQPEASGDFDL